MKPALSCALLCSLAGSALPAAAGDQWARVRDLEPGTEIVLAVKGGLPETRYVIASDEFEITTLNVTDPTLPAVAAHALRELVARRPDCLVAPQPTTRCERDDVRVGADSVSVGTQKVAELARLVEVVPRSNIARISALRARVSATRTAVWAAAGSFAGTYAALAVGFTHSNGPNRCGSGSGGPCAADALIPASMVVGGIWGGLHGVHSGPHTVEQTIYRAP